VARPGPLDVRAEVVVRWGDGPGTGGAWVGCTRCGCRPWPSWLARWWRCPCCRRAPTRARGGRGSARR